MGRDEFLGLEVRLVRDQTFTRMLFPDYTYESVDYPKGETFLVEHDFRETERDGIRVACPDGSWVSLTGEQFSDMFGVCALARLDALADGRRDVAS